jgi:hypothetical protein
MLEVLGYGENLMNWSDAPNLVYLPSAKGMQEQTWIEYRSTSDRKMRVSWGEDNKLVCITDGIAANVNVKHIKGHRDPYCGSYVDSKQYSTFISIESTWLRFELSAVLCRGVHNARLRQS